MLKLLLHSAFAYVVLVVASGCAQGGDVTGPSGGLDAGAGASQGKGGSAGSSGQSGASMVGGAAGGNDLGGAAGDVSLPEASIDDDAGEMDASDALPAVDAPSDAPVDAGGCPGGGKALQFSGTQSVTVNLDTSLPIGKSARTVEMWTKMTAYNKEDAFFEYGINTTDQAFALDVDINNRLEFYAWNDDLQFDTGLANVSDWFHLAVVSDGAGKNTVYVNGVEKGTKTIAGMATVATTLTIGRSALVNQTLDGIIDEVRVWNVARSVDQLNRAMKTRLVGNEAGLVGYWRFDDGSGSMAIDSSTKKHDAILVGGPSWVASGAPLTCP